MYTGNQTGQQIHNYSSSATGSFELSYTHEVSKSSRSFCEEDVTTPVSKLRKARPHVTQEAAQVTDVSFQAAPACQRWLHLGTSSRTKQTWPCTSLSAASRGETAQQWAESSEQLCKQI